MKTNEKNEYKVGDLFYLSRLNTQMKFVNYQRIWAMTLDTKLNQEDGVLLLNPFYLLAGDMLLVRKLQVE